MVETATAGSGKELLETVCDRERVAIIFNPASGTQDAAARRALLEAAAHAAGLTCALSETDRDCGALPLARKAVADGMERVLVSGGDGSMMEAANALAGSGVALAVLPGGTGNLLAMNLGLPLDCEAAVQAALTAAARPLDIGWANGTVFLIMAGMGLDARMVRDAGRAAKQRLGVLAYIMAVLHNVGRPPIRYAIRLDGRRFHRRAKTVLVANMGRITGGVELVPGSDPEDGLLEVAVLRAETLWDLVVLAGRALLGRQRNDTHLELLRGRRIVIETARPQPLQLDGNEMPPTARLEVHVEPGALQLVRPSTTEAGTPLAAAPIVLTRRAGRLAGPLLAGTGLAAALALRARAARHTERQDPRSGADPQPGPTGTLRRWLPLLAGLAAVTLVLLLAGRLRADARRCLPREGGDEPSH